MTRSTPNRWPAAIIVLVLVFLVGLAGTMYWGITRASRVSDPAYSARGNAYGSQLREELASREWSLEAARNRQELTLRLTDGADKPLNNAKGTLTLLASDGTDASRQELVPGGNPGTYLVSLPDIPPQGARALVVLRHNGSTLRRSLLVLP